MNVQTARANPDHCRTWLDADQLVTLFVEVGERTAQSLKNIFYAQPLVIPLLKSWRKQCSCSPRLLLPSRVRTAEMPKNVRRSSKRTRRVPRRLREFCCRTSLHVLPSGCAGPTQVHSSLSGGSSCPGLPPPFRWRTARLLSVLRGPVKRNVFIILITIRYRYALN